MRNRSLEVLQSASSLLLLLDSDGICHGLSQGWRQRLGLLADDPATMPVTDLLDTSAIGPLLQGLFTGNPFFADAQAMLRAPDGAQRVVLCGWLLDDDATGQPLAMLLASPSDVDEGIDELKRLRMQHQLILDSAGEGVWGLDRDGKITFGNKAAVEILGWQVKDVLGKSSHEVHHHSREDGSTYPRSECPIYASLKDGEVHRVNNEVFWHTSGKPIPVDYVSSPILKNGKPDGAVIVFRDNTEQRKLEQQRQRAFAELEKLRNDYQLILDAAGEGIYGLDSDGRITFSNAASTAILGWQAEAIFGQKSHAIHHHSHADGTPYPREECPIYAAITDGEVHHIEDEVFWHVDGSPVPVAYTSTPIFRNGKPDGAVVVFRDITDRKEMEKQREEAYREVNELKEKLEQELDYLRDEVNTAGHFGEIIGNSDAIKRAMVQVSAVAQTPASVLILGESGVGKEMIARAIHKLSPRARNALVKVNCASIPTDLFESEFFGHVKGSFTGAYQDRVGRLQLADGGTLFLDEVGEIPMSQQGKLLRALQENEFERVGDDRTQRVDVRVIAATNRNLEEEIRAGRFREDLYYRLSVFPIEVPPLRKRISDVVPLAITFLDRACKELGREPLPLSKNHVAMLRHYDWPGNIRELKNTIERAVISSPGNKLRLDLAMPGAASDAAVPEPGSAAPAASYLTATEFRQLERDNIVAALKHANWKTWGEGGAADLLGIKPSTLAYQMKKLGISKPA